MEITTEQKQEIYEHLLSLECPDLLAALIAKRSTCYTQDIDKTISDIIGSNFDCIDTPETADFWLYLYEEAQDIENVVEAGQEYEDALQESLKDDFESPTELDLPKEGSIPPKIEVNVEGFNKQWFTDPVESLQKNPSFFDKVKLFFGKIFYKV
jgi:hypothetical protein